MVGKIDKIKDKLYDIGQRIRTERKKKINNRTKKPYTQDDLAEEIRKINGSIRINRDTIGRIENGEPVDRAFNLDLIIALCKIFDCEAGYLLCEEGYEEKTRTTTDICKETGLTPEVVNKLRLLNELKNDQLYNSTRELKLINYLLSLDEFTHSVMEEIYNLAVEEEFETRGIEIYAKEDAEICKFRIQRKFLEIIDNTNFNYNPDYEMIEPKYNSK